MKLFELASAAAPPGTSVPAWALGSFRRQSITFFEGFTDRTTEVRWLQSHALTFDLRLAADRPRPATAAALATSSPEELVRLAEAEGGIGRTAAELVPGLPEHARLSWDDWNAFQPYSKWPETGVCRRVGDCLIEFAPSGAYVEDWRYQAAGSGPLIGLRLLEERDRDSGAVLHRGGGLVICGSHAGLVRGRAHALPDGSRAADLVREAPRDRELIGAVFGCEASYARANSSGSFVVSASTLPWREGEPLLDLDGFAPESAGILVQRTRERNRNLERRFRVDTLLETFVEVKATAVSAEGAAWLERERATLQKR